MSTTTLGANQAVLLVARREFVTQVRSRSFVVGIVVTLVLVGVIVGVIAFVSAQTSTKSLGLTPQTASLRPSLEQAAEAQGVDLTIRETEADTGRAQVAGDGIDALLTGGPGSYQLLGRDTVDTGLQSIVATAIRQQTLGDALAAAGRDPAEVAAQASVAVATVEPADPNRGQQLALAFAGTFLLFFSLSSAGQLVATGVVEEKQSRVVELLLATIQPWQLLAGKILGLAGVGLAQLVIFSAIALVGGAATGQLTVPGAAAGVFGMIVFWYLLGFFLFAALYAAVGSTVSRQEELPTVVTPLIFLLIIPFILTVNLLPNDPRNELAAVLSFVPFFSQTVMPARYALGVASLGEVGVAALLTLGAVVVVVRVAGRVYRNSVLRTGARVSLREALRG